MLAVALAVSLLATAPDPGLVANAQVQDPAEAGPVALEASWSKAAGLRP